VAALPGPESRTGTGNVRRWTEAEFRARRQGVKPAAGRLGGVGPRPSASGRPPRASRPSRAATRAEPEAGPSGVEGGSARDPDQAGQAANGSSGCFRAFEEGPGPRSSGLYAIHVGKDRSEVVNDLLRPPRRVDGAVRLARTRRSGRNADSSADRVTEADGEDDRLSSPSTRAVGSQNRGSSVGEEGLLARGRWGGGR